MGGIGNGSSTGGAGQHNYAPGDIVLGKIKGYPPWPGVLCHEDNVPKKNVLSARPGKNYHIVRFFPAADYGFNRSHELRRLTKREIEAFLSDPHKRAADLREAYKLALDPESWNEEQNDAVRQAEEEGEEEEDMLADEDGQDEDEDEQPVKKRKSISGSKKDVRTSSSSNAAAKKRKKESAPSATKSPRESSQDIAKSSSNAVRQRELSNSPTKPGQSADGDAEEAELDPETKKVKSWRYALQHAFLPRSGAINGAEVQKYDETFKEVERYEGITAMQLRQTKIGKVMKRVVQLKEVPHDEEYHFRQRAQKLCDIWGELIAGSGAPSGGAAISASSSSKVDAKSEAPPNGDKAAIQNEPATDTEKSVGHAAGPVEQKPETKQESSSTATLTRIGDESTPTQASDANSSTVAL